MQGGAKMTKIDQTLQNTFSGHKQFTMQEAYQACEGSLQHSVRARIYDGLKNNLYLRLAKGVYVTTYTNAEGEEQTCVLVHGDGRDLSALKTGSINAIITDHPYDISGALKGGNRDFASYDLFQYTEQDFAEKFRVLKPGGFLVEFIPEESAENFDYLTRLKQMAMKAGFLYYSKVPWKKGDFVANTGRKYKNTEDVLFFTKGKSRSLRPDAKKDKADPSIKHYMSGAHGMLPTVFDYAPPTKADRIHQAEKPVELLKAILGYVTLPNEWVLDQFAGSGVLGQAAMEMDRKCYLIEKDEEAIHKICNRLNLTQVDINQEVKAETNCQI